MTREHDQDRFKISLYENGIHSLKQGLHAYREYQSKHQPMQLKDAIMGIHHGVELLLKEMLVKHNQFLIFENLRNVARKQKQADHAGVGIFYIDHPPRTVTFRDALSRVEAFIRPDTLDDELISLLEELNRYRNQLEHYAVDADLEEVAMLVADIRDPLLALLESVLGEIKELRQEDVEQAWSDAKHESHEAREFEQEVKEVVERFSGQKMSGSVFSLEEEVILPHFKEILEQFRIPQWPIQRVDLFARADDKSWAIEVKRRLGRGRTGSNVIQNLRSVAALANAVPWLVLDTVASDNLRSLATEAGVMLSDSDDLKAIRQRLDQPSLM